MSESNYGQSYLPAENGTRVDELAHFDRITSRRHFLATIGKGAALAGLGVFGADPSYSEGPGQPATSGIGLPKPDMIVHSQHPFNGEFPPHLLAADVTPTARHFVRNNGSIPERARRRDAQGWSLTIDGEVRSQRAFSLDDLHSLPQVTLKVVLECAGNGRSLFAPPVDGTQWMYGAVACSEWTGVRLRDLLQAAEVTEKAVYLANYGEDDPPFSRGIPIEKAMDEHTLIALKMNGEPLPAAHGFPARLLVPGWIGSSMQKWLNRIWVRDTVHDSAQMSGYSYRVPSYPIAPGDQPPEADMTIATSWVVKSLITAPQPYATVQAGVPLSASGHAWAGERSVTKVLVSTDSGVQWQEAELTPPANKYAWYGWSAELTFSSKGYREIWARAFDDAGNAQPFRQPWNPKGYLGNVIHQVPIAVSA